MKNDKMSMNHKLGDCMDHSISH